MNTIFKSSLFALVLLLVGAGCTTTSNVVVDEVAVDNTVTISGITFDLPEGFTVESVDDSVAMLGVPHSEYKVTVPFTAVEVEVDLSEDEVMETTESGVEIYANPCGGALGCWYLVKDDMVYQTVFQTAISNEPLPEDLDGIWVADMEVESEVWLDIIRTAK